MAIVDQFGRPLRRYARRSDADLDAEVAQELRAEQARRRATTCPEIADNEAVAAEETVSAAEHERACAAARVMAYSQAYAEGLAEGKKAGAAAVDKHFLDIINGCRGDDDKLLAALAIATEFPEITAVVCVGMAERHFAGHRRGAAALANRAALPDSLALAKAQLQAEGA
ncbi:hypothetical protein [Mesorhizobium sp.]|uniref:hypothetical protein n=1 Tax=Mesorhizobium sp. TaxID=1871066 RepID=UPI000FE4A4DA|nr:hypothetical protein [Mesorhizobium sp.]RWM08953.1 MAG: hypothetical protein EOR71_10590 [Mesorhizobium sp.]